MKVMKKILMMAAIFVVCGNGIVMTSCSKDNSEAIVTKNYFQSWNNCEALTALQAYVEDVTNPKSASILPILNTICWNTACLTIPPTRTRHPRMYARQLRTSGTLYVKALPCPTISI